MLLFQRIKSIARHFCGTNQALAEQLDLQPTTFQGYLNEKRQDNLWPLLPRILKLFPQINRNWLYFGEGEMIGEQITPVPRDDKDKLVTELLLENRELRKRLEAQRVQSAGEATDKVT